MKPAKKLVNAIVEGLTNGVPLRQLCRDLGVSKSTVYNWMDADEELSGRIAQARARGFEEIFEHCMEIADTTERGTIRVTNEEGVTEVREVDMLGHRKLRVETRLKLLSKWDPKRYGDKMQVDANVTHSLGDRLQRAIERTSKGE